MSSPSTRRRATQRAHHPSSPSPRRRNRSITPRKLPNLSEPIDDVLQKSSSVPLFADTVVGAGDDCRSLVRDGCLYRSSTCADDVFSPSPPVLSPLSLQAYPEVSKVLITVTVEGTTGPIRMLVKLNASVEEAINLVIDKYAKEGRSPPLDTDAASHYQLHLSSFSLESLDRSDTIGNTGSRTFYLRKRRSAVQESGDLIEEITCTDEAIGPPRQPCPLLLFLPDHLSRKITKMLRRMSYLWKMFGCLLYGAEDNS